MHHEARIPSNRMPAYVPGRPSTGAWFLLAVFATAVIVLCISYPPSLGAIAIIALLTWVHSAFEVRRQRKIAAARQAESICSFARSFDCRTTDTWIVRAVFEEISRCVRFPLRPEDRFERDLKIESDDIDALGEAVARRTGRPLDRCEENPLFGKVKTVRDVVEFFLHQPRRPRTAE